MARAVILTGSNVGDSLKTLDQAAKKIEERLGRIEKASSKRGSLPWGDFDDKAGDFVNQILVVETTLAPEALLRESQKIERELGRNRAATGRRADTKYLSREIDIDILYYDSKIINSPDLTIPHPLIAEREFVLTLLVEIIPKFVAPDSGHSMEELLERLRKNL